MSLLGNRVANKPPTAPFARHPREGRCVDIFTATDYEYDSFVRRKYQLGRFLLPRCVQCTQRIRPASRMLADERVSIKISRPSCGRLYVPHEPFYISRKSTRRLYDEVYARRRYRQIIGGTQGRHTRKRGKCRELWTA